MGEEVLDRQVFGFERVFALDSDGAAYKVMQKQQLRRFSRIIRIFMYTGQKYRKKSFQYSYVYLR